MRMKIISALIMVVIATVACKKSSGDDDAVAPAPIIVTNAPLHTDGRWFKDSQGRVVILRGINISNRVKRFPYDYGTAEADYDNLYSWGFNVVRLLISWEAIEPEEGVFNDALFDKTAEQIQWAAERGIYILLDMHQDVWGSHFNGNGAPVWATLDLPFEWNNPWGINYFASAIMANYDNFFSNTFLQDHFAEAWLHAVKRFIDRPNVIGYDLYNEPYFGTLSPWEFERDYLGKFQDRVAAKIRAEDPNRIIFYEPLMFTSGGIPSFLPPPALKGNIAFAPHYYDPTLGMVHQDPYDGDPSRMAAMMDLRDREVKGLGDIPWLLGEFGIAGGTNSDLYVHHIYNLLEKHMVSNTYWSYDSMGPLNADGSEKPRVDDMARPYPVAIAGTPYTFSFDQTTKVFTLSIKEDPSVQGPTEIFVLEARHYPGGFIVESTGTDWSYDYDGRILKWHSDSSRYTNTITIKPAP